MFTIYINDLAASIGSSMRLFANDAVVYKEVATSEASGVLLENLQRIDEWGWSWQLSLNVGKCACIG